MIWKKIIHKKNLTLSFFSIFYFYPIPPTPLFPSFSLKSTRKWNKVFSDLKFYLQNCKLLFSQICLTYFHEKRRFNFVSFFWTFGQKSAFCSNNNSIVKNSLGPKILGNFKAVLSNIVKKVHNNLVPENNALNSCSMNIFQFYRSNLKSE